MTNLTGTDPRWVLLMRQIRHEVATPVSVTLGYLRMLERFGPLNDKQRHVIEEATKSAKTVARLLEEIGSVIKLEASEERLSAGSVDIARLLQDSIDGSTPPSNDAVQVLLRNEAPGAAVRGNREQLQMALVAVLWALRREIVEETALIVHLARSDGSSDRLLRLTVVEEPRIALKDVPSTALTRFFEWRGGCGLTLALARRIIALHGGEIFSPVAESPEVETIDRGINVDAASKHGAVILLPEA